MKKLFLLSALAMTMSLMPSCKKSEPVTGVTLPKDDAIIVVGNNIVMSATTAPRNAKATIEWGTDSPDIVSVNSNGKVIGLKPGIAKVYASCGIFAASRRVVVLTDEGTIYKDGHPYTIASPAVTKDKGDSDIAAYTSFKFKFDNFDDAELIVSDEWLNQVLDPYSMPNAKTSKETGLYLHLPDASGTPTWYNYVASEKKWVATVEGKSDRTLYSVHGYVRVGSPSMSIQLVMTIDNMLISIHLDV